ncbi:YaaC family protein [Oceanobacillus sp. Castelsardo]|uniref:YaaC family protein n=1 Tax=Oceanobacillus sp. Castelsardo TaxID=1851204 RepID=UPI000837F484|nr:YaaC family protein [Oceanobacillus sp. Castelsardo]
MSKSDGFFSFLSSQQTAQVYLKSCYEKIEEQDVEVKSYQNYNALLYYLDHGRKFYEIGHEVDVFAKPVLYFYGLTHLLKACLLTKRPNYPESTVLLSHGVTSRKRKKRHYTFMTDEVKVQLNGLFPYFSEHLYSIHPIPFEKIQMKDLFSLIPEMQTFFSFQGNETMIVVGSKESRILQFPISILDHYHITKDSFLKRIGPYLSKMTHIEERKSVITVQLDESLESFNGPFYKHMNDETIYFPLNRKHFLPISEVMIHYLLLYNLSMLCRYEAEWWGDLLSSKPELDYPFILQFLDITAEKIPKILENELYENVHKNN